MKVTRETQDVFNEPLTVINTPRLVAYWAGGICVAIAYEGHLKVAAVLLLLACVVAQVITRLDPDAIGILPAVWRFQMDRSYDPIQREYFELEITESDDEEEN